MMDGTMITAACAFAAGAVAGAVATALLKRGGRSGEAGRAGDRRAAQGARPAPRRHAPPADGSIEIYVGNMSYELTEDQLRKEFEAFGKVNSARIITYGANGRSKGFGFVHMPDAAEVEKAIKALDNKEILGRRLRCNVAKNQ